MTPPLSYNTPLLINKMTPEPPFPLFIYFPRFWTTVTRFRTMATLILWQVVVDQCPVPFLHEWQVHYCTRELTTPRTIVRDQ